MQMDMNKQLGRKKLLIAETIEGLFLQTDEDWSAIIVVDMHLNEGNLRLFNPIKAKILSKN